jgi:hypothetical protein
VEIIHMRPNTASLIVTAGLFSLLVSVNLAAVSLFTGVAAFAAVTAALIVAGWHIASDRVVVEVIKSRGSSRVPGM